MCLTWQQNGMQDSPSVQQHSAAPQYIEVTKQHMPHGKRLLSKASVVSSTTATWSTASSACHTAMRVQYSNSPMEPPLSMSHAAKTFSASSLDMLKEVVIHSSNSFPSILPFP